LIDAAKKAQKIVTAHDPNALIIRNWDSSKFAPKDLRKLAKDDLVKEGSNEVLVPGPEMSPTPPAGYQVMFLAFFFRGLTFPAHEFFRALLFAYGI
jgi:hypothetical protein